MNNIADNATAGLGHPSVNPQQRVAVHTERGTRYNGHTQAIVTGWRTCRTRSEIIVNISHSCITAAGDAAPGGFLYIRRPILYENDRFAHWGLPMSWFT